MKRKLITACLFVTSFVLLHTFLFIFPILANATDNDSRTTSREPFKPPFSPTLFIDYPDYQDRILNPSHLAQILPGQVNFTEHVVTTNAPGAKYVYAADIDGDGDADVVSASSLNNNSDEKTVWYENVPGNGTAWTARLVSSGPMNQSAIYVSDIDSDGDMDILSGWHDAGYVNWYENDGQTPPNFTYHSISSGVNGIFSIVTTDLDADGDMDVLTASHYNDTIAWHENVDGNGLSWSRHNISTAADGTRSVHIADVDGDGDTDVLSASVYDDKIAWYESDGLASPGFTEHIISTSVDGARSVYATDIDGDDDVDILATALYGNAVSWFENDGGSNPSFTNHIITSALPGAAIVSAEDIDEDGDEDVLATNEANIFWYENDGSLNPNFTSHTIYTGAGTARSLYTIDIDGDGDMDLTAGSASTNISWWENLSSNSFSVSGYVADTEGNPIEGVIISNGSGVSTTTSANGDYNLTDLPRGSYQISPSKNYYVFTPASTTVTIPPSSNNIDFAGAFSPGDIPFTVFGSLRELDGTPIANTQVIVQNTSDGTQIDGYTDSNGNYILNVGAGSYTIWPSTPYFSFSPAVRNFTILGGSGIGGGRQDFTGYPVDINKPPLVFVHGWKGADFDNGCNQENPDDYFQQVDDELRLQGYFVEYAYLLTSACYTPHILDNVDNLIFAIDRAKGATGQSKVILIAHSMGGLVSRAYVEGNTYRNDVLTLFTFGSPHLGTPVADILPILLGPGYYLTLGQYCVLQPAVCDFSVQGMTIFNLFHNLQQDVDYHFVGGDPPHESRTPKGKLLGWIFGFIGNDGIVPLGSSRAELLGLADRWTTDESHGPGPNGFSPDTYFLQNNDPNLLSYSYYNCLEPLLIPYPVSGACGNELQEPLQPNGVENRLPVLLESTPYLRAVLGPGETYTHSIGLEGGPALFATIWETGTVGLTLVNPGGQVIDAAYAATHPDEVLYEADSLGATYYFTNTLSGNWQMVLLGNNVPISGSHTLSFARFDSSLTMTATLDNLWYTPGVTAHMTASLPVTTTDTEVTATIWRADTISDTLILNPQGNGLFTGSYVVPDAPGYTEFRLLASGTLASGLPFSREDYLITQISPQSLSLTGNYSDTPILGIGTPTYTGLEVAIEINSIYSGAIGLSAELHDASGQFVTHSSLITQMITGTQSLDLIFAGADIANSGYSGPLLLTRLLLIDLRSAALVVAEEDDVYMTNPYDYRDFALPATGVVLQGPSNGLVETNYVFTATASPVTATVPLTYTWSASDHSAPFLHVGNLIDTASFGWSTPGQKIVTITVQGPVNSVTATWALTVFDVPLANLTVSNNTPVNLGTPTILTATVESGTNINYIWAFGNGEGGSGSSITYTYPSVGVYTAVVTASNAVTTLTATTMVTITDVPINNIAVTNDSPTVLGQETTFTATVGAGSNVSYTWDLGDGHSAQGAVISYAYASVGQYTAVVTASNSVSRLTETTPVLVVETIVGLAAANNGPVLISETAVFTATIAAGSNVTYIWGLVDGAPLGNGAVVTTTFGSSGLYTAVVTATNAVSQLTATTAITVYTPVQASFIVASTSGIAPFTAVFTNTSTGDYTHSLWVFGDGLTSTLDSPTHIYTDPGVYTVSLTVSGPGGVDWVSLANAIIVYEPVQADFTAVPTSGPAPLAVQFTNTSTGDFDTCAWMFGDGGSSSLCSGSVYTYTTAGVYTVTLIINGLGGSDVQTKVDYIVVQYHLYLPVVLRRP